MADSGSTGKDEEELEDEMEKRFDEEAADEEVAGITEYEKERLQIIKRNRDMLAKLQVTSLAKSFEPAPIVKKGNQQNRKKIVVEGGRRRSQRLSAIKGKCKVVDWSSSNSSGSDVPSDSESDGSMQSFRKKKKKKKTSVGKHTVAFAEFEGVDDKKKEDIEYVPTESSDSEDSAREEDESEGDSGRGTRQSRKDKTFRTKSRGRPPKSPRKQASSFNSPSPTSPQLPPGVNEEEYALQQALALSMGSPLDTVQPRRSEESEGKSSLRSPRNHSGAKSVKRGATKRRKGTNFEQIEIDALFVSIVGSQQGRLSMRHLEKVASTHDFTWTEEQLKDMIDVFDQDNDGQISLAEFRKMAVRCQLMEAC